MSKEIAAYSGNGIIHRNERNDLQLYIPIWMEGVRHKTVHTLLFYLHKAEKETKRTYAVKNKNIDYHCVGGGKGWE